jgi:hypothetical protein
VSRLQLQLLREPAHDRIDGAEVESFGQQSPQEVPRVERSFAHERLGIDHEPGFALGGEKHETLTAVTLGRRDEPHGSAP